MPAPCFRRRSADCDRTRRHADQPQVRTRDRTCQQPVDRRQRATGDARDDHIVEDLIDIGKAGPDGNIHVDVLKVQHHGSENNFSAGFAKRVTAGHHKLNENEFFFEK